MSFDNKLYYGDNLVILKELAKKDSFIDLIYIDPPFNSQRNYNLLFEDLIKNKENGKKTTALKEAFSDTWSNVSLQNELEDMKNYKNLTLYNFLTANRAIFSDGQMSYLTMMAHRLYYMHQILKDTGSFYLHCDPTMSHYLKIILDIIFGRNQFQNEIIWCYGSGGASKNHFSRKHDVILFYTKSKKYCFNTDEVRETYSSPEKVKYKYIDGKAYLRKHPKGRIALDWWQIPILTNTAKERLGYPTQKPLALLEKIIKASSNKGDVVADFFCGCGTTVTAAEQLNRKWLGVDINHLAIGLIEEKRLNPLKANYKVIGFPSDKAQAEKLAQEKPFEFETWVVEYFFKGHATKKTRDGGFDGHLVLNTGNTDKKLCLLEVKGGKCNVKNIREFGDVMRMQNADLGIFVCFEKNITSEMLKYCDNQGTLKKAGMLADMYHIPMLTIITIEQILDKNMPVWLEYCMRNITY